MRRTCLMMASLSLICWLPVYASNILFFNQDCNVESGLEPDGSCGDERSNLLRIINTEEHTVTLLPDFHDPELRTLLTDHDFLLIPELEDRFVDCKISDPTFLSATEKAVLKNYIEEGGRLLIAGSSQNILFLNSVFGLDLILAGSISTGDAIKNEDQAVGTPFEDCTAIIPNLDLTFLVNTSMPENKRCIYSVGGDAALALFEIGDGHVIYLGYDFNNAGPGCAQEASLWGGCIIESSVEVAVNGPNGLQPIPTLSEWAVFILFLGLLILGVLSVKDRKVSNNNINFLEQLD